ncbi:ccr4-not transcription complex subunit 8 [Stylonychia lemnae]|uniref:poly(A)-specific ribonuclease n=1 Tax=Stylonychia lemnae TaxID=5949 RepID=A0A078B8D0_STYLE|nr:ccr4-not transcription complex subunit 8 [Stylonychia lemnae]|eukprot:CDW89818.1 ccr4-not transcription complex subunit 8 [Stylonychia lemnae]
MKTDQLNYQPVYGNEQAQSIFMAQSQQEQISQDDRIKDVWIDNFFEEMENISRQIENYNYISMDTEYPGTVFLPPDEFEYQMVKVNVNNLKLIQVGITLSDSNGAVPSGVCSWQFNLFYDISQEQYYAKESMDLLKRSGFDFEKHKTKGIRHSKFGEYLMSSGLCLNPDVHWITFHGGVDFGYMLKVLMDTELPSDESSFFQMMNIYFINYYDIKEVKRDIDFLSGGLSKIAKELDIERIGTMHQAGSDSLVTSRVFFKLKDLLKKWWPSQDTPSIEQRFQGIIYGLGPSVNEDIYIEEYRSLATEYSNGQGKLINMNNIGGQQISNNQFGEMLSSSSTTISTCDSINSLSGAMHHNNQVINQQHYLLMQQQQELAKQQNNLNEDDYSHFYRNNLPTSHINHLELMQQQQQKQAAYYGYLQNNAPAFVPTHIQQNQHLINSNTPSGQGMFYERYGSPPAPTGISPLLMQTPLLYFQPNVINGKGSYQ